MLGAVVGDAVVGAVGNAVGDAVASVGDAVVGDAVVGAVVGDAVASVGDAVAAVGAAVVGAAVAVKTSYKPAIVGTLEQPTHPFAVFFVLFKPSAPLATHSVPV